MQRLLLKKITRPLPRQPLHPLRPRRREMTTKEEEKGATEASLVEARQAKEGLTTELEELATLTGSYTTSVTPSCNSLMPGNQLVQMKWIPWTKRSPCSQGPKLKMASASKAFLQCLILIKSCGLPQRLIGLCLMQKILAEMRNRESQSVCACLHKSGDFGEFRLVQTFTSHITHILRCNDTSSSATDL